MTSAVLARLAGPVVGVLALGGAIVITAGGDATPPGGGAPAAWIDDPLAGSEVPADASVAVVAHATHPAGVDAIQLRVDDEVVATASTDGDAIEQVELLWDPDGPGLHLLAVRGRAGDSWTPTATVTVTVGGEGVDPAATTSSTAGPTTTGDSTSTTGSTTTAATATSTTMPPGQTSTSRPPTHFPPPPLSSSSSTSSTSTSTTRPADTTGPTIDDEFAVAMFDTASLLVQGAASDPSGVERVEIWFSATVGGRLTKVKTCTTDLCQWTGTGLTPGTNVQYQVVAYDDLGNQSATPVRTVALRE